MFIPKTSEMEANIVCKICCIQALLRSCINTITFGANFIGNVVALCASAFVVAQESGFKNSACFQILNLFPNIKKMFWVPFFSTSRSLLHL